MKPFLSIVIPAYNEAKSLPLTLIDAERHLSKVEYSWEMLVVNDGSKDDTAEVVRRFSGLIRNLRLVDNAENHGKGWVVRQGMLEAKGNWRLFMDADNATSVDQVNRMMPYFKEGYDIIIGSREAEGSKLVPPQPWYKRILGRVGNLIIQMLVLPGLKDTQCGFKCFSEEAAERIFKRTRIDRWSFDVETLVLGKMMGYKIKEIPVTWVNNIVSRVKLSSYIKSLWEVLKLRIWLWRGDYRI
jgi:dolichyl-phosphate beta-glucosyltransferase